MDEPEIGPGNAVATAAAPGPRRGSAFLGVPIEVTISVGKARPLISDLV